MRGNPDWFGKRGLTWTAPTTWRGWLYLGFWTAAILGPAWMFLELRRGPEMLIWAAASSLALWFDWRRMRREAAAGSPPVEDVFVIDDDRDVTRLASRRF